MDVRDMSGLELIQAMCDGTLPHPNICDTIPMRISDVSPGFVKFRVRADSRHMNPLGGVHGGFAATVLDSATGCAVHTMLEPGVGFGTIDLNVKMLRPVPMDQDLIAEGAVIHISKTLGVSAASLKDAEGRMLAHATCTCAIFRPKSG
jgi:uncharacterized protein (TIGR00369 family)